MLCILLRWSISPNLLTYIIIMMMSSQLSLAQSLGEYLDIGGQTGTFKVALTKGFHPGSKITVNGTVQPNAERFFINLENDSGKYVYLHINPRFDEQQLVFSHKIDTDWSPGYDLASKKLKGLTPGANFEITVLCNATGYMINVNKQPCFFFEHRFETSTIRNIKFSGPVTISSVRYIPGNYICQLEGCPANSECVSDGDDQFQCVCSDGYSGPLCQESCKNHGCTGNNVCVFADEKYRCRSRSDIAGASTSSDITCRQPYVAVDNECVWVVMSRLNWDAARFRCQDSGGFLMEPDFPVNFKLYMSNNYPENDNTGFWVGGADRGLQRWVWVTSLTDIQEDFPWGHGEPNDLEYSGVKEDCMSLYTHSGRSYFYNDAHCTAQVFYICESQPLIAPTAAALVVEKASVDPSSLNMIFKIQVAILLLLTITMISVVGAIIYKNANVFKKAYSSFGSNPIQFSNHFVGKLSDDDDN